MLETDRYDDIVTSEISCACNYYHFVDMETTILKGDMEGENVSL